MTIIIIILLCDLILSVPTLATVTLSGFFLGHIIGTIVSLVGLSLIGVIGYIISYYYGERVERKILKKEKDRLDARQNFHQHGFIMILFSRALPMLPEICACMAGLTNMSFSKFFIAWTLSNLPYVLIATYAGSVSSIDNLSPAIITSIGIYLCLGLGWLVYRKLNNLHLR
jgi:uncharacterized membrane protein YdjX (TVP38/TMEM64 family)